MNLADTNAALVLGPGGRSLALSALAPRLSAASAVLLREISAVDEQGVTRPMQIPFERPLTLILDGCEIVTLMTLGAAPEWLAMGYLRNHRLIDDVGSVLSVEVDWAHGTAVISTRHGRRAPIAEPAAQSRSAESPMLGCALGTAFAETMRRFDRSAAPSPGPTSHDDVLAVLETARQHDAIHRGAGSVHSCALFRGAELWVAVEDVSRHNGVDIVTGFMSLYGVSGADKILFTTGRLTGEMVMKAAHHGISVMISRNGTTSMGYDLAAKFGMTLIGRAANRRYVCYTGHSRIAGGGSVQSV